MPRSTFQLPPSFFFLSLDSIASYPAFSAMSGLLNLVFLVCSGFEICPSYFLFFVFFSDFLLALR